MNLSRPRSLIALALACALVAPFALAGCSSGTGGSGLDDSKALEGKAWKATELSPASGPVPVIGVEITAEFASGKVTGNGGVNRYNATYTTQSGNKISISQPAATLMAGPPAAMAQEQAYFQALIKAATFKATADSLELLDSQGTAVVKYVSVQPKALVGTEWEATNYNNGKQALVSLAGSSTITATFGSDGFLSGNASVNQYHTKYTTSGTDGLTIEGPIQTTKMAGPQELMDQEAAYLAALPKTTKYEIIGDELWLRDSGGAAMAVYRAK